VASNVSPYVRSYNSFSGVDIKGVFGSKVIAELQGISHAITREKAPIYTMGSADPRSFSRGKRGIAGTLIFVVFDKHAILGTLGGLATDNGLPFQSDIDDIRPAFNKFANQDTALGSSLSSVGASANTPANTVQNQESGLTNIGDDQKIAAAWYADQIPPFDITLAAANEYGAMATMAIFGVELLNEGSGVSIDDIQTEQQHTYVARSVLPWTPVASKNLAPIAAGTGIS
jgi:hypothetical protein